MLNRRFFLYLLVGMLNTAVGYGIYSSLIFAGLHYSLATVLATICCILFNFKSTGKIVFKNDDNYLLIRFILVYVITCIFNVAGLRLYKLFGDNMYLAGIVMIFPSALVSFVLLNRFVFNKKPRTI